MLKIENLHVSYGGIQALRGISLEVPDGKIVTLIGANGAGKSTTLRTISGLVKASSGSIQWNGEELLGKPIDQIISAGIAMSPEGRRVFADMTVLENLRIGAYLRKDKAEIQKDLEWVYQLFPRLQERSWQLAGTLSGGESFLASLALALGLSDAVQSQSGQIRMDAMFIDEGFGSLDENALRSSIDVLLELADGKRLIGIISHVQELEERIDKQIVVTKTPNGSTVRMNV